MLVEGDADDVWSSVVGGEPDVVVAELVVDGGEVVTSWVVDGGGVVTSWVVDGGGVAVGSHLCGSVS